MRQRFVISNGVIPKGPTPILAEWWRKRKREKERMTLLRSVHQEPLSAYAAKLAGVALGVIRDATIIDAIVMDPDDLQRLRQVFLDVLVVGI